MDDSLKHHIYFESRSLRDAEKKKILNYFHVRRKSGGGDCGDLRTVKDNVYRLSFKHREDQEAVLRKSQHVVKCGEKDLVLMVRESVLEPLSASPVDIETPDYSSSPAEGAQKPAENESTCHQEENSLQSSFTNHPTSEETEPAFSPDTLKKASSDNPGYIPGIEGTVLASYQLQEELTVVLCHGDITKQSVDAVVNAANESLDHEGGGVSAALIKAGGPEVQVESRALVEKLGRVPVGEVVMTNAGHLKCKKLLHAVGPVSGMVGGKEKSLIQETVCKVLSQTEMMGFRSVAMPCISSGSSGVPISVSSEAIVTAIKEFGSHGGRSLKVVVLVDNREAAVRTMQRTCDEILQGTTGNGATRTLDDPQRGATPGGECFLLELVNENIEDQQVDAIVCPMAGHDPDSTRIGNTLSALEGPQLSRRFYEEAEDDTYPGDTVVVEGFSALRPKAVLYVHLAPWDHDHCGTAVDVLKKGISNILDVCESRGFKSIAFPLLGVGAALRFPEEVSSKVLYEELYGRDWPQTHSTPLLVRFVIPTCDPETIWAFLSVQEDDQPWPMPTHESPIRVALLGKTGAGKSSLANTIFCEDLFITDYSPLSETKTCQAVTRRVQDQDITLVDTPGFFDTNESEEAQKPEIMRLITECSPGPHALFIVLKVEKYTEQEQEVINKIFQYFSEEVLKYTIVIFTHGDQLEEGKSIEEFVNQSKQLSELLSKCDNRYHVVDNKYWNTEHEYRSNSFQVGKIVDTVVNMVKKNKGAHYSNVLFETVERAIVNEVSVLRETEKNTSEDQLRKKAQTAVSSRALNHLAGIGTGMLLGALFGGGSLTSGPLMTIIKCMGKGPGAVFGAVAMAVDGAVKGACIGHKACQENDSPKETVKATFNAFMKKIGFLKGP